MKVIENNGRLVAEPYGFRPGRSVNLQLLEVMNYVYRSVNTGKTVDTLYLDFKKPLIPFPIGAKYRNLEH